MLTLINTLSLATALTLQPISSEININISKNDTTYDITTSSNLQKDSKYTFAFDIIFFNETNNSSSSLTNYNGETSRTIADTKNYTNIGIGYNKSNKNLYDIAKYEEFNNPKILSATSTIYQTTILEFTEQGEYNINIKIRSTTFMEELLTALTTAVQSAVSIFVEGFGGLTQIFYNGTEITFIGGILIVGLAVMFLMMFLRWIVSFVKGI